MNKTITSCKEAKNPQTVLSWPAKTGTTVKLPSVMIKNPHFFGKDFSHFSWDWRSLASHMESWNFILGLNSARDVHITNTAKYGIDWKGFLVIRNVSQDDELEYRNTFKKKNGNYKRSYIILRIVNETGKRLNVLLCNSWLLHPYITMY